MASGTCQEPFLPSESNMLAFLNDSHFPSLSSVLTSSLIFGLPPSLETASQKKSLLCKWEAHLIANNDKSKDFSLSFILIDYVDVNFLDIEVDDEILECGYSLVVYAIGKRPFYGSLLIVVK